MSTVTITVPVLRPEQLSAVDAWLRSVLWESNLPNLKSIDSEIHSDDSNSFEIHRLKALLPLTNGMLKMVQGVREVFDITDAPKSNDNPSFDEGKIVLIGRGISHLNFKDSYLSIVNPA
jgi:hypothetical protein